MQAEREHVGGTAIPVVARIGDMRVIEREVDTMYGDELVIRLAAIFRARMRQPAVAGQNADPVGIQIALMLPTETVDARYLT